MIDGQNDYSSYSQAQLFDALIHIDRGRYPLNLASLERELAIRPADPDLNAPVNPAPFPPELDRWNWGAFVFAWLWGIFNRTYIAFVMLVPLANLVFWFFLGRRGSRWAWRNRLWEGPDHFRRVQRKWAVAALIFTIVMVPSVVAITYLFDGAKATLRNSATTRMAVDLAQNNPQVVELLGTPLVVGRWGISGNLRPTAAATTEAHLVIKVTGPKKKGAVTLDGKKAKDQWIFDKLSVSVDGRNEPIDLAPKPEE